MSQTPEDRAHRRATGNAVYVIMITGVLAVMGFFVVNRNMETIDWILCTLVLVLTIGGGIALARFIRANPGAIGEARFDTTNRVETREGE
jgi:uncharacterized protein (DUF983 family)